MAGYLCHWTPLHQQQQHLAVPMHVKAFSMSLDAEGIAPSTKTREGWLYLRNVVCNPRVVAGVTS